MLLKSLRLHNFRQYKYDKNLIEFSIDKEKNVTVILGKNTGGKTTILQAFNWILYGVDTFVDKTLLNLEIQGRMGVGDIELVEVELKLIHDNRHYCLNRKQRYKCEYNGSIRPVGPPILKVTYIREDGQTEIINGNDFQINDILHQELSDYFFFDGERIENISSKKDISKAVKDLMGLNVLGAAKDHLGPGGKSNTVISKLKQQLDLGGDERATKAKQNLENAIKQKESIEEKINTISEEIDYYENDLEKNNKILRDDKSTAELQKRKEQIQKIILPKQVEELERLEKRLVLDFNDRSFAFFSQPLAEKALGTLEDCKERTNGIPEMHAKSIEHLIERGFCICGNELCEGSKELRNVLRERELLPPNSIGTIVRNFKQDINRYERDKDRYYEKIKDTYERTRECRKQISDLENELINISRKIENKADMQAIELKVKNIVNKIRELRIEKERQIAQQGRCEKTIEDANKIIDSLTVISERNGKILEYLDYAQGTYDWFEKTYSEKEVEIKERLTNKVNQMFSEMYHGERTVEIDSKYIVSLITTDGERNFKSDESRGLETVKNFAFIAGLVDLAREKITSADSSSGEEELLSAEPYPLVMDAPFSNADEIHVQNISKVLPQIAEQVILVVMDKDWSFAKKTMETKIGKKYILEKKSETLTEIKGVQL